MFNTPLTTLSYLRVDNKIVLVETDTKCVCKQK